MTTVTGLTADRMLAIEAASVVDGDVDGNGNLILTKHDGTQINAGSVKGPQGPAGPVGQDKSVLSAAPILDVGIANQIRAGRQLSPADFAAIGLNAPLALWNLSDLSDASGNGRNLLNKGAVPFASGINGIASTAANFSGVATQGLYISDTGAADPFRIRFGSMGAWFRSALRSIQGTIIGKLGAGGQYGYELFVDPGNLSGIQISGDGSAIQVVRGFTDPLDDRWHFIVGTFDGHYIRLYLDGVAEVGVAFTTQGMFGSSAPFNIGGRQADGSNNNTVPFNGRIDEAFITTDVLSEDQVRNLYCAKIGHTLGAAPARISLNVRRLRKGAALASADFPTRPLRLHNFSAGSLGDEGSNNVPLTINAGASPSPGSDGVAGNSYAFNSTNSLVSSDTGLPVGVSARSLGCWVKTLTGTPSYYLTYGAPTSPYGLGIQTGGVLITTDGATNITGPYMADGQWHFVVVVADNGSYDNLKQKVYIDGKLVGRSQTLGAMTLGGANGLHVGSLSDGTALGSSRFVGFVDGVFICDYALTSDQIRALYAKGSQILSKSPKNVGDHIEGMDANNLYAIFDILDSQHQIDLAVA